MRRLVAIMFLMAGLACAETSWFFAPEDQKDAPVSVNFRKNALDGIFSQAKIDWDGDGLYIFRERGDSLRLIVVAKGGEAVLYQKPSQKESRWRNPEAYLREREGLKGYSDFEIRCGVDEPEHINDYRDMGLAARKAVVTPGSVRRTHEWLQCRKIIIDPARTPNSYREFTEYEHDVDRNGEVIDGYPDRDNHYIDAVRYATSPLSMGRGNSA